jgi:hypothetical protein
MIQRDDSFWIATVDTAVKQMFKGIIKKRSVLYITKRWILIAILMKIIPRFFYDKLP